MAQIGLKGAGLKPARSPRQRTGHRPLSNPPLCFAESSPASDKEDDSPMGGKQDLSGAGDRDGPARPDGQPPQPP